MRHRNTMIFVAAVLSWAGGGSPLGFLERGPTVVSGSTLSIEFVAIRRANDGMSLARCGWARLIAV
jgi:hypothetical protein